MRILQELRFLSRRHDLTLVAFYQLPHEAESEAALLEICRRVYLFPRPARPLDTDLAAMHSITDLFAWHTSPAMQTALEELQREPFDAVLLHHIFMAQYGEVFSAPALLQEHNIESDIFKQHALLPNLSRREHTYRHTRWMLMRRYEDAQWQQFSNIIAVSEQNAAEIRTRSPKSRVTVVENGIDVHAIQPLDPSDERTLLFMGSLDFYPNIDAVLFLADTIMPRIWARDPDIRLIIAGRRPPNLLRALAANPRIEVIADPPDMTAIARRGTVALVPLRIGSGTRGLGRERRTAPLGAR